MAFTLLDWLCFLIAIVLAVCLVNLLANFAFVRWAKTKCQPAMQPPFVSVLVPARDEAVNIAPCMASLLNQDYPNYEVIGLNDDSTDDTGAMLDRIASQDRRLQVLHNHQPLPAGWNGKSRACQILAEHARGDWLLFVDADTVHRPDSIRLGVEQAVGLQVALFSVVPKQILGSWGERMFLPAAFGLIYAFTQMWRIYLSPSLRFGNVAAIGQFLLVQREAYFVCGGHHAIRAKILDDQYLALLFKRRGYRIAIIDGAFVACRMYRGFRDMARGFSKNAFANLNGSLSTSFAFVLTLMALFVLPLAVAVLKLATGSLASPAWVAVAISSMIFIIANVRIGQSGWTGLLYPLQLLVGVGILLNSMCWHYTRRTRWKGRTLSW